MGVTAVDDARSEDAVADRSIVNGLRSVGAFFILPPVISALDGSLKLQMAAAAIAAFLGLYSGFSVAHCEGISTNKQLVGWLVLIVSIFLTLDLLLVFYNWNG